LFGEGLASGAKAGGGAGGGAGGNRLPEGRIQPVRRIPSTEGLTDKERVLLTQLRESLFERHAKMKTMFSALDPNGDGFVTIEEFLHALTRAGVAITGEIDRAGADVTPEEAARLLAYFDRDGDGSLEYNEFMRVLQDSKHMVMASAEVAHGGHIVARTKATPAAFPL